MYNQCMHARDIDPVNLPIPPIDPEIPMPETTPPKFVNA
jgi:hypothetical protein